MSDRKAFPLRIGKDVFDAVQGWADDELRSVNAQIEFALREALMKRGRLKREKGAAADSGQSRKR